MNLLENDYVAQQPFIRVGKTVTRKNSLPPIKAVKFDK